MLDSFDKESKLQERRAARQRQMRLMEEAASGLPLSSLGPTSGTAATASSAAAAPPSAQSTPPPSAFPTATSAGSVNVGSPPNLTDIGSAIDAIGMDGTFAIDDDDDHVPRASTGATSGVLNSEAGLDFVYGSSTTSITDFSPRAGGGGGVGGAGSSNSSQASANSRRWMSKAEKDRDNEESRKLILLASRRLTEDDGTANAMKYSTSKGSSSQPAHMAPYRDNIDDAYNDAYGDVHGEDTFSGRSGGSRISCPTICLLHWKLMCAMSMVVVIAIVMAATLTVEKPTSTNGSTGSPPWQSPGSPEDEPTVAHPLPPEAHEKPIDFFKFNRIKDRILEQQISHASSLENEFTAQYKALVWIVRDDERQLDLNVGNTRKLKGLRGLQEEVEAPEGADGDAEWDFLGGEENTSDGGDGADEGLEGFQTSPTETLREEILFQRYALAVLWFQTTDIELVRTTTKGPKLEKAGDDAETLIQWNKSNNWLSKSGLCMWHGVTCHERIVNGNNIGAKFDGDYDVAILNLTANNVHGYLPKEVFTAFPKMRQLDLSGNEMEGRIGTEIGKLTDIEDLFLHTNHFTGSLPTEVGYLSTLFDFDINDNEFRGNIPTEIGNMVKLREVSFFNNNFSGKIPEEIGNLQNVIALYLDVNKLTGEIPTTIGKLSSLVDLRLRRNDLSGEIPKELGDLSYLETLYLDINPKLTGAIPTELAKLQHLDELHLYQNNLKGQLPKEFGLLNELTFLYLDSNDLTGSIPEEWGEMSNLQQLFLAGNRLNGQLPQTIRGMESLQFLRLSDNEFTGRIPSDLGKLLKLENVYLEANFFTGPLPASLGELTKLKTVHFHDNDLTGDMPSGICKLADSFFLTELTADCAEPNPEVSCECCDRCN